MPQLEACAMITKAHRKLTGGHPSSAELGISSVRGEASVGQAASRTLWDYCSYPEAGFFRERQRTR